MIGEHQATINQNMPLRSLMYIGRIYEQLIPVRSLFGVPEQEILTEYTKEELEKAKKLGSDSLYGQTV